MVGQKLSIVTDKPQTTRHRILSCLQIILYDAPGVIKKEMHKLDSMMMKNVRGAIGSADCVLVVADACKAPEKIDEMLEEGVGNKDIGLPVLLVLNKKNLIKPGEIAKKLDLHGNVDDVIPISAKFGNGVDDIKEWILSKLPLGPAYYPKNGKAIKMLATTSRLDIEDFLQKKVYLEIEVKVKENWRQDERLLKRYGYGGEIRVL
ncbi:hypothetical protein BDA96_04G022500 [Sorghum bicolor]|uniref:Era-type G domain-containing protein n=1 Tax=Sorghum bicolor TaxID=4558 RepID=A0A921R0K1_SORBI|nr:hypothetical protein BDA96_04G022500 [Sorghum bicolor]